MELQISWQYEKFPVQRQHIQKEEKFLHVNKQTKHIKKTQIIAYPQNISFSTSLKCHSAKGSEDKCTLLLKCHSVKGKMCVYFRKNTHTAAGSECSLS